MLNAIFLEKLYKEALHGKTRTAKKKQSAFKRSYYADKDFRYITEIHITEDPITKNP